MGRRESASLSTKAAKVCLRFDDGLLTGWITHCVQPGLVKEPGGIKSSDWSCLSHVTAQSGGGVSCVLIKL